MKGTVAKMAHDNFKTLTDFIDSLPSRGFPGMDVTAARGHEIIYRHSAGYSDLEEKTPVSGRELYYMYSCTKVVTCTAALQLMERGKFIMSQPVSDFLPEFAEVKVKSADGAYAEAAKKPILMRHLFNMTSGYAYDLTSPYIQQVSARTGGRCPTRETVAAMAHMPLEFEPGSHFRYGLSHDILAAVVEAISGESFGGYVRKNILEPCGMTESGFGMNDAVRSRMAKLYSYNVKEHRAENTPQNNVYILGSEYESGGAGLISSVSDYIKFADALACGGEAASGERILSPRTVELMRQNCLDAEKLSEFTARWPGLEGYGYGYGVRTYISAGCGSLSPLGQFGWQGAAGAYVIIDPASRTSLFFAMHMLHNQEAYVFPRLCNAFFASLGDV